MQIRLAKSSDVRSAAQLWFDRITLLQQTDRRIKLLPDAREHWSAAATRWTSDDADKILGVNIAGHLLASPSSIFAPGEPGMQPHRRGLLLEMVVDLHETHRGLTDQLLDCARRGLPRGAPGKSWWTSPRVTR